MVKRNICLGIGLKYLFILFFFFFFNRKKKHAIHIADELKYKIITQKHLVLTQKKHHLN